MRFARQVISFDAAVERLVVASTAAVLFLDEAAEEPMTGRATDAI